KKSSLSGCVLELISTAGGRFHFITVQGRHLFKETTFTVSTLPRAWLEPPCPARGMPALRPRQEVCKRWPQRPYLACLPLKLGGFSRPSSLLLTVGSQDSCYPRRTRRAPAALHSTKKMGLYFRGVAAFRFNQRGSASN